ncbi:MAG: TauD/TfdA family dioxygenase, partial [Acidimicrobiales bacterium]
MIALDIRPLEAAGAEVMGVDLAALDDATSAAIHQAFADYGLLFFRDQDIDELQHIAFAE